MKRSIHKEEIKNLKIIVRMIFKLIKNKVLGKV